MVQDRPKSRTGTLRSWRCSGGAPVALPAGIVTLGGLFAFGRSSIIGAVSQTAVSAEEYGDRSGKSWWEFRRKFR